MQNPKSTRRFLLAIFVISGFTGLIYESIWSHYLRLFLGHAAYSQTLVLAIYMGGMALGSWAVSLCSPRIRQLLWMYVLVEGLIGIFGIVFHKSFVAAVDFSFGSVIPHLAPGFWIHAYKWSLATLLILPQSMLLGATFPLISGGLIRRWPERPGETLATLYFTNSLGAAIGVLVSGFVLIGAVGLPGTILCAGLINLGLALVVWLVVRVEGVPTSIGAESSRVVGSSPVVDVSPAVRAAPTPPDAPLRRWIITAAFLTGAASFMYELGWIRMLSLVLGSSTHAFELMLSAFIFGLAFGGLYLRRHIEKIGDPVTYLAGTMIAMGILAVLTLPAYSLTFDAMAWFLKISPRSANGYWEFNGMSQLIAALIMVPASFCAGIILPMLTHELMQRGVGERAIGHVYSANTMGAIAGVIATVHLLMPEFGVKGVIFAGAAIHISLGLSRLVVRSNPMPIRALAVAAGGLFAVGLWMVRLDPGKMTSGVYRTGSAVLPPDASVDYLRDGKTATISLVQMDGVVTIATNGKPDASLQMGLGPATVDESTMVLAAAIPLSMHANPARIANIGFGSGLTTHTLLASGLVKQIDSIEIEPLMVEAARKGFGARIHNVFEDPRSHIIYEDAKTFFAGTRNPYDLIVSEPSNPWVSGVSSLFSDEFYGRIARYLAPDGYFVQWIQVYETNFGVVASIIKALAPHFGAYALYNTDDSDILIVATRGATLRPADDRLLQWPLLQSELGRIGVQSVADLQLRKIGDNHSIGPLFMAAQVPANSDFYPYVDLNAPRMRYLRETASELPELTFLPIPFLELAEVAARAPTLMPNINSELFRDRLVRRALDIRTAVSTHSLNELDPLSANYLSRIEFGRDRCLVKAAQIEWKNAVRNISDDTAAYLNASELAEIWAQVLASPCYRYVSGEHQIWADLFAAISRRDSPKVVELGTLLLGPTASTAPGELAYLTTVTAAAEVQMGEITEAQSLLRQEWARFDHNGPYDLALRDLLARTRSKSGATF